MWVLSILKRSFGAKQDSASESEQNQAARVAALSQILDVLPDAAAIVDASDQVLEASANCIAMGLVSNGRIAPVEIRALNREVHRLRKTQSRESVINRSGSKLGNWEARVQISPIDDDLSLMIAQDLSE